MESFFSKIFSKNEYIAENGTSKMHFGGKDETVGNIFVPNLNLAYYHKGVGKYNKEWQWININRETAPGGIAVYDSGDDRLTLDTGGDDHDEFLFDFIDPLKARLKWNVILKQKPISNIIRYRMKCHSSVEFRYQDTLEEQYKINNEGFATLQDMLDNVIQGVGVAKSYAIYCNLHGELRDTENNVLFAPKTGKLGHLYRPKITDDDNAWVYGDINITPTGLELNDYYLDIVIPQTFLDSAVYPITVDPTLGSSVCGSSNAVAYRGVDKDSVTAGDFTAVGACATNFSGSEEHWITSIYFDEGGGNDTKLAIGVDGPMYSDSESECDGGAGTKTAPYVIANHPDGSGKYWMHSTRGDADFNVCHDTGASGVSKQSGQPQPASIDWSAQANSTWEQSAWGIYTVAGGAGAPTGHLRGQLFGQLGGQI